MPGKTAEHRHFFQPGVGLQGYWTGPLCGTFTVSSFVPISVLSKNITGSKTAHVKDELSDVISRISYFD